MNAHRSLSERTAIGVSWTAASAAVTLAGTVISQTILALFLTDDDFGAYAIAVGFSAYLTALKSGGVRVVLMRRPPKAVLALGGSALVLASVSSVSVAGILFGLSGPVARIYDEAVIEPILQLIALALVVDIYTSVAMSSLQSELRFSAVARIDTGSSIIQYTSTILLAILGFGPLSFAMPLVFAAFFRSVTSAWFTRNQDWTFRPKLEAIQEIFAEARWSLGGTAASALLRRSDYVVLGLLTPTRFVGVYFFAYQLAFVTVSFIWQALSKVLIPSFGRVADNPRVREGALIGGVQVVSLFATPAAIMLGLIIEPLEELLWNGRWTAAVTPIQIFSLFAATEMCLIVIQMVIQSMGAFRLWTVQVAMRGCGLAAAVAIAALISDTSISIVATIVVGYLIASACLQAYLLLNAIEIGMGEFVRAAGSGLAVNLACALAAALTTRQLVSSAPPLVQIGALLATYLIVFVILIRALAKRPWFHDFPSSHNIPIATTVIARLGLTSRR